MENTINKYTEKLAILKENREKTVDTNTDAENELYDQLIKQVAEFVRDLKQLNILCVSNCRELLLAFAEYWNGCNNSLIEETNIDEFLKSK